MITAVDMDGKSALTRRRVFVSTDLRETPAAELAASFELIATPVDCDGLVAMPTDAVDAALSSIAPDRPFASSRTTPLGSTTLTSRPRPPEASWSRTPRTSSRPRRPS